MRRLYAVSESGYGSEWVVIASEMGPGVEGVAFVPEAGYGATPAFVVSEMGPGARLVFPVEGRQFIPPHLLGGGGGGGGSSQPAVPPQPNMDLLSPEEHAILGRLDAAWDTLAATNGADLVGVQALLEDALNVLNRPWPEAIWSEDVFYKACIAAVTLAKAEEYSIAVEPLQELANELISRDWLFGGPCGYLDAATAQETLRMLPIAQRAVNPSSQPPPDPPKGKKRFGRR